MISLIKNTLLESLENDEAPDILKIACQLQACNLEWDKSEQEKVSQYIAELVNLDMEADWLP